MRCFRSRQHWLGNGRQTRTRAAAKYNGDLQQRRVRFNLLAPCRAYPVSASNNNVILARDFFFFNVEMFLKAVECQREGTLSSMPLSVTWSRYVTTGILQNNNCYYIRSDYIILNICIISSSEWLLSYAVCYTV